MLGPEGGLITLVLLILVLQKTQKQSGPTVFRHVTFYNPCYIFFLCFFFFYRFQIQTCLSLQVFGSKVGSCTVVNKKYQISTKDSDMSMAVHLTLDRGVVLVNNTLCSHTAVSTSPSLLQSTLSVTVGHLIFYLQTH